MAYPNDVRAQMVHRGTRVKVNVIAAIRNLSIFKLASCQAGWPAKALPRNR